MPFAPGKAFQDFLLQVSGCTDKHDFVAPLNDIDPILIFFETLHPVVPEELSLVMNTHAFCCVYLLLRSVPLKRCWYCQ